MFGKNIRHFRLMAGLSQEALAERVGLQKMSICHYENNKRSPDADILKKICDALNISASKLLDYQNGPINIDGGYFRKSDELSAVQKDAILSQIECEANRYALLAEFVGHEAIESSFPSESIALYQDAEKSAESMRLAIGLSSQGPIGNLLQIVENAGIFVVLLDIETSDFSGYCYRTDQGFPIISINNKMTVERQRFSIAHELAHLLFDLENKCSEKEIDNIAGCFLLPKDDIIRELGSKRKNIGSSELLLLHDEYGVSGQCVALRAFQTGVISGEEYKKIASIRFPSKAAREMPNRYAQLVYRAFFEGEIGISMVADMLGISLLEARSICGVGVSAEW